jgi:hypothetical protein
VSHLAIEKKAQRQRGLFNLKYNIKSEESRTFPNSSLPQCGVFTWGLGTEFLASHLVPHLATPNHQRH